MLQKLYPYRFEIFFFSQIAILFGSLVVPAVIFESVFMPVLFQINLLAGIILVSKNKKLMWFLIVLLAVISIVFGTSLVRNPDTDLYSFIRMASYFLFYIVVTHRIIKQVWVAKRVNNNVIFGLISGYVSLGLIGFFICISIEMANPESFQGFLITNSNSLTDDLLYFSYITLLTIGYGDIMPITPLAQKATILIGLIGQIYLVIISAVVVGKYINQNTQNND